MRKIRPGRVDAGDPGGWGGERTPMSTITFQTTHRAVTGTVSTGPYSENGRLGERDRGQLVRGQSLRQP